MRKLSQEEFLQKAYEVHGDTYDYTKSIYTLARSKITITCKLHGDFTQSANGHLNGKSCMKCGYKRTGDGVKNSAFNKKQDFSHITPPEGSKIVPLTKGKYALVDEEDYERVMQYNWFVENASGNTWYASGNTHCKRRQPLQNFILENTGLIDHINHNGWDNRKSNLRVCTPQQNSFNNSSHKDSLSVYKGVSWSKQKRKWIVQISKDRKHTHVGFFVNEEDAARAYDKKAKELFGEFAYLNFPY